MPTKCFAELSLMDGWMSTCSNELVDAPMQASARLVNGQIRLTEQTYDGISPNGSHALSPINYQQHQLHLTSPATYADCDSQLQVASRRSSIAGSCDSSHASLSSSFEDGRKDRCPYLDCGKVYKDIKAHLLTHQNERPEKCPISTCEYKRKGFARKFDKDRHTLSHYKGTMVCDFCPGSGSAAEKSFNRVDTFKRHLISVHGVDQTPLNSRKRASTTSANKLMSYDYHASGNCSTCSNTFANAQVFYEHLDGCVLRVLQQEEPSEAINAQHLASDYYDRTVKAFFNGHQIKIQEEPMSFNDNGDDEDEDEEYADFLFGRPGKGMTGSKKATGRIRTVAGNDVQRSRPGKAAMTRSNGAVALARERRKKRKHYPPSWGMSARNMQMKNRVVSVYDGERRLYEDDMMLHNGLEIRRKLLDGKSYVTDLDVETLERADVLHNAAGTAQDLWMLSAISPETYLTPAFIHQ